MSLRTCLSLSAELSRTVATGHMWLLRTGNVTMQWMNWTFNFISFNLEIDTSLIGKLLLCLGQYRYVNLIFNYTKYFP